MLKAIVSYAKKIPVPESQFSSQSFSLALETEVTATEAGAIQAKLHETFDLVKATVEQELANGNGNGHTAKPAETGTAPARKPAAGDKPATNRQIQYITSLLGQQDIALSSLNAEIRKRYGVQGLYDLTSKQAGEILDSMTGKRKAA